MSVSYFYDSGDWTSDAYKFHLDEFKVEQRVIKGWLVRFEESVELLFKYLTINGEIKRINVTLKLMRPKLKEIYPDIQGVEFSGFSIDLEQLEGAHDGDFYIVVGGVEKKLAKVCIKPPLLYVHIAKTAGSTVNKVFLELFGAEKSMVHVESSFDWQSKLENNELSYLSGHIPFSVFNKNNKIKDYKKAITFREPFSHIVSHLCWIRSLSLNENKERYEAHPEYIRRLSDKLEACDFSVAAEISNLINNFTQLEHRLLDNTQVRYIRSDLSKLSVDRDDLKDSIYNVDFFDFIGTDCDIHGFISDITDFYGFRHSKVLSRENVLDDRFGLNVEDYKIREALFPLVQYDLELYSYVTNKIS